MQSQNSSRYEITSFDGGVYTEQLVQLAAAVAKTLEQKRAEMHKQLNV